MEDKEYIKFIGNIKKYLDIDLGLYKETQMNRRIRTLYEKRGFTNYEDYFLGIKKEAVVLEEFLDRMTINVTEFFRNANRWDVVVEKVIPEFQKKGRKIKCWSAACSTGEEPYTLAMLMMEKFPSNSFEILATDIDTQILEKAKKGVYTEVMLKGCPDRLIRKYFKKEEDGMYHISEEVKKNVKFKKQDLLVDTFEKHQDLIICRNVMIYFTEEAKNQLYKKFNQALNDGGIFFVGSTEQIFHPEEFHFGIFDAFFYYKK